MGTNVGLGPQVRQNTYECMVRATGLSLRSPTTPRACTCGCRKSYKDNKTNTNERGLSERGRNVYLCALPRPRVFYIL